MKLVIAGITGWTGKCLARAVLASKEFELAGAVARKSAGQDAGHAVGMDAAGVTIVSSVREALKTKPDAFIDYTSAEAVRGHVDSAVEAGIPTVIGSSGLTASDYEKIGARAKEKGIGVFAAGNFSITATLVKKFALLAAKHVPHWEVIDYTHAHKPDAPSGTARELAEALSGVADNRIGHPVGKTIGNKEARGAQVGGTPVHSVRLPGFVFSYEALFGLPNERISIRHDAGEGADPYVQGTLLAAKKVLSYAGIKRGMDSLLFEEDRP